MNSPCWQCIRRYPACHGDCPDYAKFREMMAAERMRRQKERDLDDYQKRTSAKIRKRNNDRRGSHHAQ